MEKISEEVKTIVISGINIFEGGPLSVFKDCLNYFCQSKYIIDHKLIALVHKKALFNEISNKNIKFIEFPKSRKSYVFRLYYEYFYFKKFANENDVYFWFSLHDITPNLKKIPQAVYCHNASPFNSINVSDLYFQPTQFFFRLFYRYLYKINIKNNKFVVVQQLWIKEKFIHMFNLDRNKIIIAPPKTPRIPLKYLEKTRASKSIKKIFFFPTFPRPFKNIEVICEAVKLVLGKNQDDLEVIITIDGTENKYANWIVNTYKNVTNISFIGLIARESVYEYYSLSDCLIFPSKLETWGLPISEYKQFNKPMLVANLPYAKETVGNYELVNFFDPSNAIQLSQLMINFLNNKSVYDKTSIVHYEKPYVESWDGLFQTFLG